MHSAEWVQFFPDGRGRKLLLRLIIVAYRAAFIVRTILNSKRKQKLDWIGGSRDETNNSSQVLLEETEHHACGSDLGSHMLVSG